MSPIKGLIEKKKGGEVITEGQRRENINRIVTAARLNYIQYGIESTTQKMLAATSGLSTKTIKRYFPDRLELIYAVAKEIHSTLEKKVLRAAENPKTKGLTGQMRLLLLLKSLSYELLGSYKEISYMQAADYYCRQHALVTHNFWDSFRNSKAVRRKALELMFMGIEDKSIKPLKDPAKNCREILQILGGYVERLASKLVFKKLTLEESIENMEESIDLLGYLLKGNEKSEV